MSMVTGDGSIAAMAAISRIGSKAVLYMDKFQAEKLYLATMHLAQRMLSDGLIDRAEYRKIEVVFREKYKPVAGTLFADIDLL